MDTDRQRSLAAGMDDHASKPIDSETIAEILERHIGSEAPDRTGAQAAPEPDPEPQTVTTPAVEELEPAHLVPRVRV
jgi:two-component system sensor histidine kinase/response regulator